MFCFLFFFYIFYKECTYGAHEYSLLSHNFWRAIILLSSQRTFREFLTFDGFVKTVIYFMENLKLHADSIKSRIRSMEIVFARSESGRVSSYVKRGAKWLPGPFHFLIVYPEPVRGHERKSRREEHTFVKIYVHPNAFTYIYI